VHFAFVSIPAHGHINPTLPLVEELVDRGHRVTYATHESFTRAVYSVGATLLPLPGSLPSWPVGFVPAQMTRMTESFLAAARADLPILVSHFEQDPPDGVCYDVMTFTGTMLTEKLGLPAIALNPSYASNERFSLRAELMSSDFNTYPPELLQGMRRSQELIATFAAEHGVSQLQPMSAPPAPLNIVFIPREFQIRADTFDDRFHFVGPSLGKRATDDGWRPRHDGKPLLFIALGSVFTDYPDFFRICLEAFSEGPWQVAMAVGRQVEPTELGPVSRNFEIRQYFPQPSVLRYADVFLSHAGMNSTMESLYFGVPLVVVPQQLEPEANARQIERLGLGRRLAASTLSPELLCAAVTEVATDPVIRANVARMKKIIRNAAGAVAAADAIESHLTHGSTITN
jgi:MGT family glycosyltransferase